VSEIVLMADRRVTGIPVAENGDPMIDVAASALLRIDTRAADDEGSFRFVRQGVLTRLEAAARALPDGISLVLIEGYRTRLLQTLHFADYLGELTATRPDLNADDLFSMASRYISPPEIAPHSAGAAVDVTLVDEAGNELDMGCPVNATPEKSDGACYTDADNISETARANRTILVDAMAGAGFVNYPTEWWHWSYGDRYWALTVGEPAALYGPR
jgi:D-alanyl-D-alanine dipeptidase